MPTYEYVCSSCRRHTEAVQRFSDPPLTECPHCGGALKRVFHPVGIVLKGSGFYSTDNRGSRSTIASTPAAESSESKTDSASSETKSAAKTDSAGGSDATSKKSEPKETKKSSDKPKKATE